MPMSVNPPKLPTPPASALPTLLPRSEREAPISVHTKLKLSDALLSKVSSAEQIGPYEVLGEMGRGGMGRVLKARDPLLRREVAVKQLLENKQDDTYQIRFLEEAQITGQLEHPGILPVHMLSISEDGQAFFSMRLASGRTFEDLLRERFAARGAKHPFLSLARLVSIFERIVETVGYAHSRLVIHRDLKPGNIMVGEYGEVWVLDWGLAKSIDSPDGPKKADLTIDRISSVRKGIPDGLTLGGTTVGTPAYMAPEQARGEELSTAADIYSLGAILYHILTSQPPHSGKSQDEIIICAAEGRLVPVRETKIGREAPKVLAAICEKCLMYEAHDRYASTAELLSDLRAYMAGEETLASPDRLPDRIQRWMRRHRAAAFSLFVLVFGSLAMGLIVAVTIAAKDRQLLTTQKTLQAEQQRTRDAEADALKSDLEKQKALAESAQKAKTRLAAFEPYTEALDLLNRGVRLNEAEKKFREAIAIDPDFAEAYYSLGETLRRLGIPLQASDAYLAAHQIKRKLTGKPQLAALLAAAFTLDDAGEYTRARDIFIEAEHADATHPLAQVGKTFTLTHDRRLKQALSIAREVQQKAPEYWEAQFALGYVTTECVKEGVLEPIAGREQALSYLKKAFELDPRQAEICTWISNVLLQFDTPEALAEAQTWQVKAITLEPKNPNRKLYEAFPLIRNKELAKAEVIVEEAKKLGASKFNVLYIEASIASQRNDLETSYEKLGELARKSGFAPYTLNWINLGLTLKHMELMEELDNLQREHPDYAEVYVLRAMLAVFAKKYAESLKEADLGLALAPYNLKLLTLRSQLWLGLKNFKNALEAAEKGLKSYPKNYTMGMVKIGALMSLQRKDEAAEFAKDLKQKFPDKSADIELICPP